MQLDPKKGDDLDEPSELYEPLTLGRLIRHADRFGPEGVMEIAVSCNHLGFLELVALQEHVDMKTGGKHRKSAHDRVEALLEPKEAKAQ